jgi:hypothetical protein
MVKAFHRLNGYSFTLEVEDAYCRFETGIAEDEAFTSIGEEETKRFEELTKLKALPHLDFLIHAAYWRLLENGKTRPLWGDLHRVRIVFVEEGSAEIQICHLRGTRRIPLDDLVSLLIESLQREIDKAKLTSLEIKEVKGH